MARFWSKGEICAHLAPNPSLESRRSLGLQRHFSGGCRSTHGSLPSRQIRQAISGFPCHWAYAIGNTRLSCALCVLANTNDILNGARHNPWIWAELALMETVGGWGFQQGRWLASLTAEVLQLSFKKRDRLHQVLGDLDLMERWKPGFSACLLRCCPPEQLLFSTHEAFLGLAAAIDQYWLATTANAS